MGVQVRFSFDEPEFAMIDTLFSLAEAHLFMQVCQPYIKLPVTQCNLQMPLLCSKLWPMVPTQQQDPMLMSSMSGLLSFRNTASGAARLKAQPAAA